MTHHSRKSYNMRTGLVLLASLSPAAAFLPPAHRHLAFSTRLRMSDDGGDSAPSDGGDSGAVYFDADAEAAMGPEGGDAATAAQEDGLKADLMSTVGGFGSSITSSKRVLVNELLIKLESENPTEAPATSPLLNGEWELMYTGGYGPGLADWSPTRQLALFVYAGGYAPAAFGLQLASLLPNELVEVAVPTIAISRNQPRIESRSEVTIGNTAADVKITSTLETESDVRLKETNSAVSVATGSDTPRAFELPSQLQYSRLLFVTYLDDDLLVVRDETGVPEVLLRKEKEFEGSEGEPSYADDDLAPGAG